MEYEKQPINRIYIQERMETAFRETEQMKEQSRENDSGMAQYRPYDERSKETMDDYVQEEVSAQRKMHPVGRLTNSYGDISFGVSGEKKTVLTVSEKQRKDGKGAGSIGSKLKENHTKKERSGSFFLETNHLDAENSAAAYKSVLKTNPRRLLGFMKKAAAGKDQELTQRMLPFTEEKSARKKALREEQRAFFEADYQKEASRELYAQLERQQQEISHQITKDQQEEQRMLLWLQDTKKKAAAQQQKKERPRILQNVVLQEEAGQEEDGQTEEESTEKNP